MTITLTVTGRIATVEADGHVVAGNTYPVTIALDSEWTGSLCLRVRFGSLYYDIPFASSDTSVDVQMPVGYPEVGIGVFSEALEICTNEARVRLLRSILEAGEQVVEFDSDLYDQWAGEVTTLLTDNAFDAESTRPVQNAVLTAWKDTVPLDANLVHKTGNESIAGNKTFTSRMFVRESSIPSIHVVSETAYTATGWKGLIGFFDQKDGANNEAAGFYASVAQGEVNLGLRVHKPNRSGQFDTILRSYDDHQIIITTPYYPTDSGGNPQPIGANALVASGNIAVDPRIVHTTGIENIAGAKTFNEYVTINTATAGVSLNSTRMNTDYNVFKASITMRDVKDGQQSDQTVLMARSFANVETLTTRISKPSREGFFDFTQRSYEDHMALAVTPYYPVDGSSNPQPLPSDTLMASGNLAVDPRIVHTTGNETIAGEKTFTGATNISGSLSLCRTNMSLDPGKWARFHLIPRRSGGRRVLFVVRQVASLSTFNDLVAVYIAGTDSGISKSSLPMVLCKYDTHTDLWIQNNTPSVQSIYVDVVFNAGEMPRSDPSEPMDNYPAVGEDGCTAVTTIGAWE